MFATMVMNLQWKNLKNQQHVRFVDKLNLSLAAACWFFIEDKPKELKQTTDLYEILYEICKKQFDKMERKYLAELEFHNKLIDYVTALKLRGRI